VSALAQHVGHELPEKLVIIDDEDGLGHLGVPNVGNNRLEDESRRAAHLNR
jgi:hypothetical protein